MRMSVLPACARDAHGVQERASDPLGLELLMAVSWCVGAEELTKRKDLEKRENITQTRTHTHAHTASLGSPGCSETCCVGQVGLELIEILQPLCPELLGLKARVAAPGYTIFLSGKTKYKRSVSPDITTYTPRDSNWDNKGV